ncbi:MAG: hypothetical protein RRC34_10505 [Lentisphaeria bacterium]|nr:hypothetical protein [Lentisphaeria bacterium]
MNQIEKQLLNELAPGGSPSLVLRSGTRIDVGRWWWPRRLWLCIAGNDLIMLAAGRRHYVARKSLSACRNSYYCQATGQLVIEPGDDLTFSRFKLSPREALKLLARINPSTDPSNPSDLTGPTDP